MRTGTEFVSEISAATIFTSFNFPIFRLSSFQFSAKGEIDVYRMCMCMCMYFIVSIPCHGIRSSRHQGVTRVQNVCACARSLFSNWRLRMRTSQQECLFLS